MRPSDRIGAGPAPGRLTVAGPAKALVAKENRREPHGYPSGAVAYTLDDDPREAMECNCSICRRKGYLLAFSTAERFTLETPRDALTVYTWNQHVVRHEFCRTCGCAPFGEGTAPDGTAMVGINLRCAEGVDLARIRITPFDGASL